MKAYNILNMGAKKERAVYGYLYNGYAAANMVLPDDWEIPAQAQFLDLIAAVTDGGDLKEAGLIHWDSPNAGADNSSGFTALGAGERGGAFNGLNEVFTIWGKDIYYLSLFNDLTTIQNSNNYTQDLGCSLRPFYNGIGTPTKFTDYNGFEYDVVQIGSYYWCKQNLKTTYLNSSTQITEVINQTTWSALTTPGRCAYNNDESYV